METLFAGRPSTVTNGPAAYWAEPWLGVFTGGRSERAREMWALGRGLGQGGGGRVNKQNLIRRVFNYGLSI